MKFIAFFGVLVAILPSAWAQESVGGQCGGINWTGPKTCMAGTTCTYLNDWYYQCIHGATTKLATTSTAARSSSTTTSRPSTTAITSDTVKGKYWFNFGDSYSKTGFSVTGTQPSTSNVFGNPGYPGHTACGFVPNWIDYTATTMNSTVVKVYNYAYGGATIDVNLVMPYASTVLSLADQVNEFLNYDAPGKQYYPGWTSSNSIFSIWIGINDIENSYYKSGYQSFDTTLINRYFQLVTSLYNAGARHFLFLTVPPIQRSPLMLAKAASSRALEQAVIGDYNSKLGAQASSFASSHSGVTTRVYDTQPIINAILNSPTSYGLKDATSYGSGNNVTWCNDFHISPPVHQQVAKGVSALIKGTYI